MKCNNCNLVAKIECGECKVMVCRNHFNAIFDEESRLFTNLCGSCYAKKRAIDWVPREGRRRRRRY